MGGLLRRWRKASLLVRFGITALVVVAVLGAVLGHALRQSIERRALDNALAEARVIADLGVRATLYPRELVAGLSPDRVRALDAALTATVRPLDVIDVSIWDVDGTRLFAWDGSGSGTTADDPHVREAAEGTPVAAITDVSDSPQPALRRRGTVLQAYLPLRFGTSPLSEPAGVIGTTMPFAPVAETIAAETRRLAVVLGIGLVTIYGVLFRLVAGASTALRRHADDQEHQALHDALTGLGNRVLFGDELDRAVARADRGHTSLAVALMDLDRFKEVNDTLGHHHGDLLLQEVAARLREAVSTGDAVARLGGDEFALLLRRSGGGDNAASAAKRIRAAVERPISVEGVTVEVGASLGIALYPEHAGDAARLLQCADVAMYAAKRNHLGQALYDPTDDEHSRDRLALAAELRHALGAGQLVLHYQPKVGLRDGRIGGVEALVRWRHPKHGLLRPDTFVPLAEGGDLIRPLTEAVLDHALAACASWQGALAGVGVAVNLSARNLHGSVLPRTVTGLLARHGVSPGLLTLEITETTLATDPAGARQALAELQALGVRLSIDDFGTGYSSLAALRGLPVDELKIDRSFIGDLANDRDAEAIVAFAAELGHQLDLLVVAEGVEDEATSARLRALGCDVAQGYGYAPPLPLDELWRWLEGHAARRADSDRAAAA